MGHLPNHGVLSRLRSLGRRPRPASHDDEATPSRPRPPPSDAALLSQLLSWTRFTANLDAERLKIEVAKFWSDEMAKPRHADPRRLLRHGFKIYSQNDEDGIIQEIFRRIG